MNKTTVMPYKILRASKDVSSSSSSDSSEERESPQKKVSEPKTKKSHTSEPSPTPKETEPPSSSSKTSDLFLQNEWTQVVLKALHRILQKVEAHCGVTTQLSKVKNDNSSDSDSSDDERDTQLAAKELKNATLEAWRQISDSVPHLDTAANYMMGQYLHTQAAPDEEFVVVLSRLPPFEIVLLSFINNMHDNKAALLKYWTLPLQRKHQVLSDNLRTVLKKLVLPAMKRMKRDGTMQLHADVDAEDPVRTVYLDEVHPLSNRK